MKPEHMAMIVGFLQVVFGIAIIISGVIMGSLR
jgi:hypothetical protein